MKNRHDRHEELREEAKLSPDCGSSFPEDNAPKAEAAAEEKAAEKPEEVTKPVPEEKPAEEAAPVQEEVCEEKAPEEAAPAPEEVPEQEAAPVQEEEPAAEEATPVFEEPAPAPEEPVKPEAPRPPMQNVLVPDESRNKLSTIQFMLLELLFCIPAVGLVFLFIWGAGRPRNETLRRFSASLLIWRLIIYITLLVVFICLVLSNREALSALFFRIGEALTTVK